MKALSLWQPWATMMVHPFKHLGALRIAKEIETRSWYTPHRGPLLIHAAKYRGPNIGDIYEHELYQQALAAMGYQADGSDLPYGAIIGRVEIVDCQRTEDIVASRCLEPGDWEFEMGDYTDGRFGWITNPKKTEQLPEAIPFRGAQGIFDVPDDVLEGGVSKYEHVRANAKGPTGEHHCHWPGCEKKVPPALWGCSTHWYKLPKELREEIWEAYEAGQEILKTPSAEYLEVANRVQAWIRENFPPPKPDPQQELFG